MGFWASDRCDEVWPQTFGYGVTIRSPLVALLSRSVFDASAMAPNFLCSFCFAAASMAKWTEGLLGSETGLPDATMMDTQQRTQT